MPTSGFSTPSPDEPKLRPVRQRRWGVWIVAAIVVLPLAGFGLWTAATLSYVFSSGERAGFIQKVSSKGWICKTYEGELSMASMPGANPEIFNFSIRDKVVADQVNALAGQRVALTYEQHRGVPLTCFGETEYFVTGVRRVQ